MFSVLDLDFLAWPYWYAIIPMYQKKLVVGGNLGEDLDLVPRELVCARGEPLVIDEDLAFRHKGCLGRHLNILCVCKRFVIACARSL